ncbi:hypothetical protein ES702_06547 [subsurface metagenome]
MEGFINGILGGIVPAVVLIIVYFLTLSGRLARIETNICWLKNMLEKCLPP